jgi:hypothetical protein
MSRKTRARRPSAASSCERIEFVASRRAALLWLCWLSLAACLVWCSALSPGSCVLLCLPLLWSVGSLWRFALLRGPRAIHALKWTGDGRYFVRLGFSARWLPAIPQGCLRYGARLWILGFVTPVGFRSLLVETGIQEPRALRRLSRGLDWCHGRDRDGPADRS